MAIFEKIKLGDIRDIYFLGKPIIQYSRNSSYKYIDIFPKNSLLKISQEKYRHLLAGKDYDSIYFLWNNTGETWQFLRISRSYFKKNNSKKPIIITDKKYHDDLVRMMLPEFENIRISLSYEQRLIIEKMYKKLFPQKTYLVFNFAHFSKLESELQKGKDIHFYDAILNTLGLKRNRMDYIEPKISKEAELSALAKAKEMNLDINNFVFISPEAKSNRTPSQEFWTKIENELNLLGYDTYFNIVGVLNTISGKNKKCIKLNIEEGLALASHAKAVIGLRSGFMEILQSAHKPIFCIYTGFRKRRTPAMTADKVLRGFTLEKCTYTVDNNSLFEYNADIIDETNLLSHIVNDFKKNIKL